MWRIHTSDAGVEHRIRRPGRPRGRVVLSHTECTKALSLIKAGIAAGTPEDDS